MRLRRGAAFLATLLVAGSAAAQPVYKCLEGKAVTYSNTPCEKLGLKAAGEVADRVTTLPSGVAAKAAGAAPAARTAAPSGGVPGNEVDLPRTSTVRPVSPLIEKAVK